MINANLISRYRAAVVAFLAACDTCRGLELVMTSEGGAASLFQAGDFTGANADLTTTTFTAIVTARQSVEAAMAANGNAFYTELNKALS